KRWRTRNGRLTRATRPRLEALEDRTLPAISFGVTVGANVNASALPGNQNESTIALDPTHPSHLFEASNNEAHPGLAVGFSSDGGWTGRRRALGAGKDGLPVACSDPRAVFDSCGTLFFVSPDNNTPRGVPLVMSPDGGQSFSLLKEFAPPAGNFDQ